MGYPCSVLSAQDFSSPSCGSFFDLPLVRFCIGCAEGETLYARTREELYQKEQEAIQQIENKTYRRSTPTVEEYCEKWLLMQSAQIRMTTLIDYTSKVKNYIIKPLGDMHMGDVTADDIRLALLAERRNPRTEMGFGVS